VRATDQLAHQGYIFYVMVTATGTNSVLAQPDTIQFMGPYDLRVGCWSGTTQVTDDPGFTNDV